MISSNCANGTIERKLQHDVYHNNYNINWRWMLQLSIIIKMITTII